MSGVQEAMRAARAATQAALEERHGGRVRILGETYDAAVSIGPGTEIVSRDGILANEAITARVRCSLLETAPTSGDGIIDDATSKRYEITTVRRDGDAWHIRGAIFPGA